MNFLSSERAAPILLALALGLVAASSGVSHAQQASVQVGTLTCSVDGNVSSFFGGARDIDCNYVPVLGSSPTESYIGTISNLGFDIGFRNTTTLTWGVVAPVGSGAVPSLGGTYLGTTISGALGAGVGGNVLFGGSGGTIALQPVSVQLQTGLNASLGLVELKLDHADVEDNVSSLDDETGWDTQISSQG